MMKAIGIALLLLILLSPPAWAGQGAGVYELGVDGLGCPFCAYGIEKQLTRIRGVESLDIDIREGVVIVGMAKGATLDEAAAKKAVTDAGFSLRSFGRVSPD